MKPLHLTTVAAAALLLSAGGAAAQGWRDFDDRIERLEDRVDRGARQGELTAAEARELRRAIDGLDDLEDRYQRGGLSGWERRDLDNRIDALASRLRLDRNDWQDRDRWDRWDRWDDDDWEDWDDDDWGRGGWWRDGAWIGINARQRGLDRRIDRGVRNRQITNAEARRLRDEFADIARLESRYRLGGLTTAERNDLDRRFDRLADRLRFQRRDDDRYY